MNASEEHNKKGSIRKGLAPLLLIFLVFAAFCLVCFLPLFPRLVLSDWRSGEVRLMLPIDVGETVGILFTHSLNLSDVTDTIEWTGESLVCRSTLFSTYGAGIPDLCDGIGTTFTETDEGFLLSGIDKPQDHIDIMLQTVPHHRLLYRDKTIDLLELFGSGHSVHVEVKRLPLVRLISREGRQAAAY